MSDGSVKRNNKIEVRDFNFFYGDFQALSGLNLPVREKQITALIGPSGCGKSTFLRSLNRMNDTVPGARAEGEALLDGKNIYSSEVDVTELRQRVGMVFQRPNPFPQSIYDNVAFGPRVLGMTKTHNLDQLVQESLVDAALWDEVKDNLYMSALSLNPGQQQRLCLARTLAVEPEILLCDESTASLDPISARGIEALLCALKDRYTLVVVTHDIDQARRLAGYVLFMWLGELIEHGPTQALFSNPRHELTQAYLAREIG